MLALGESSSLLLEHRANTDEEVLLGSAPSVTVVIYV